METPTNNTSTGQQSDETLTESTVGPPIPEKLWDSGRGPVSEERRGALTKLIIVSTLIDNTD